MKFIALFAGLFGCAVGQEIDAWQSPYQNMAPETTPSPDFFEPCSRSFSPDLETKTYVQSAVERWSAATGCDIYIGSGGLPVRAVDHVYKDDGSEAAGAARYDENGIGYSVLISRTRAFHKYIVAAHEIGHILSFPMADGQNHHTETGLMQPAVSIDNLIDEASLSLICEKLDCKEFNVETE